VFPAPFALEFLVQLATIVLHYPRRFGVRPDAGLKGRVSSEAPTGLDGLTWLSELELLDVRREMLVGDRLYASVSKLGETSSSGEEPRSYRCAGQVYLAGEVYVDAVFHMAALDDLERVRGEDPKPPPAGE